MKVSKEKKLCLVQFLALQHRDVLHAIFDSLRHDASTGKDREFWEVSEENEEIAKQGIMVVHAVLRDIKKELA